MLKYLRQFQVESENICCCCIREDSFSFLGNIIEGRGSFFKRIRLARGSAGWYNQPEKTRREGTATEKAKALLFFDIDGTLFDDGSRLPASVRPALEKARENGCLLFLNTGRTICNMDPRLKDLPWDGMVTGCGTRVTCRGKTLRMLEYPLPDSLRIREMISRSGVPAVYECDTAMYFDPAYARLEVIGRFRKFSDNAGIARDIREDDPEFRAVKMFCFADTEEPIRKVLAELKDAGYPYEAIDRGRGGWEIVPAGCSKAGGIEIIREELGVPLADCYAFGDGPNDLAMLEHVPNSIAMGNAPEEIREKCAFVTDRPENDGIEKALLSLGLI